MEHFIFDLLKTRRGSVVVALLAIALGTVFCLIAYPDLRDHWRLRRSTAVADAEVLETRTSSGQHFETHYDLRYRFRVPGHKGWFSHCEKRTSRRDLWTEVNRNTIGSGPGRVAGLTWRTFPTTRLSTALR